MDSDERRRGHESSLTIRAAEMAAHSRGRSNTEFIEVVQQIERILIYAISTGTLEFILSVAAR